MNQADYDLFVAARKIADVAYDFARAEAGGDIEVPWLEDRRGGSVNPFYNQTETGLFLSLYYGQPGSLWTPWGEYNCWGNGGRAQKWKEKNRMDLFLARFGATLHTTVKTSKMGEFGPVYALHSIDGEPLPDPTERPLEEYLSYEDAEPIWEELAARFQQENG